MGYKLFNLPKEVFEEQLNDIFTNSMDEKNDLIIKALQILLHMPESNRDFLDLYNLLDLENFVSVLSLFENRTITFPSKEELKEMIITALLYHYREVEDMSWEEIKKEIPFQFSSISYSIKIKKLNQFIVNKLNEVFSGEEDNE